MIDIDINEYFEVISSNIQSIKYSKLDSTRKSYREKFCNKLEEMMDIINLVTTIKQLCNSTVIADMIENIDNNISYILNLARKHVEKL